MSALYDDGQLTLYHGDALDVLRTLPAASVHCCVSSPPYYGLRSYLPNEHADKPVEIGLEETPEAYVARLVDVFRELRRVLRNDGTCWVNLGDSYNAYNGNRGDSTGLQKNSHAPLPDLPRGFGLTVKGLKPKDLIGIPWRVAFALQADGWWLRSDIIWHKPNPMPESVRDRPTKAHEYLFLLSKSATYYYDYEAITEPAAQPRGLPRLTAQHKRGLLQSLESSTLGTNQGQPNRNKRSVWTVTPKPFKGAHFAVFPPDLIEPCVLAGAPEGGIVLDPFTGSGTTGLVALKHGRRFVGIDLNEQYLRDLAIPRCRQQALFLAGGDA